MPSSPTTDFDKLIEKIRVKLPIQNPLHSYVHNNILLMFEGKDFHDALAEAAKLYRARAYWPMAKYLERFHEGKIIEQDIFDGIEHYLGNYNNFKFLDKLGLTAKEFMYRLMFSDLAFHDDETQPVIDDKRLWDACMEKVQGQQLTLKRSPIKWRAKEYWENYHNETVASSTQPHIIRITSSYLDQGQSFWQNPFVTKDFWSFFCADTMAIAPFGSGWQKILAEKVSVYQNKSSQEVIETELEKMGIPRAEWESYLLEMLFDLKGWAGMVSKLEVEPWQATVKAPNIKLVDYIAGILLIESSLDSFHSREQSIDLSLIYGRTEPIELHPYALALALYQITKSFKLDDRWFQKLSTAEVLELIEAVEEAAVTHRVRLWHEAYEHHYYRGAIQALMNHQRTDEKSSQHDAQVLFCIDDREESIRRYLEELDPLVITYGVVGFFGIDMKYSSLKNDRLIAQCPPVVVPSRVVREIPLDHTTGKFFSMINQFKGGSDLSLYYHSRTLFRGFFATLILGLASIFPMFMQIFFPNHTKNLSKKFIKTFTPPPRTVIDIEQDQEGHGYSLQERAKIVEAILRMCGFKAPITPLVVALGHGSTSNNNPFKQAYGCGACGGNAGIPNSRAFTQMANDPKVRVELEKLNFKIPDGTYFVSGFHDTCADEVLFFDLENLPESHRPAFERVRKNLNEACKLNAFERCQRFSSDDAKHSPAEALKHVQERAQDLAQPRPEYGHSTNALSIVGRRDMTKGLFMNRRSFLLTYDWATDPDASVLKQVVLGGVPVCVNISMDYYFSNVDNDNFGCGSKLPLNLTSLLGAMTGSQSDLRIGMARQMVEIHEPIRNLVVIEGPLERVKYVFDSHPRLQNILYHHWLRLLVNDPQTDSWYLYTQNNFKLIEKGAAPLQHFHSSNELINKIHTQEDFAEIDHD